MLPAIAKAFYSSSSYCKSLELIEIRNLSRSLRRSNFVRRNFVGKMLLARLRVDVDAGEYIYIYIFFFF